MNACQLLQLPNELLFKILDPLKSKDLKRVRLVNQRFANIALPLLVENSTVIVKYSTLDEFVELTTHQRPEFIPHLSHLRLSYYPTLIQQMDTLGIIADANKLRTLTVRFCDYYPPASALAPTTVFPAVTTLHLKLYGEWDFPDFLFTPVTLPKLEHLYIKNPLYPSRCLNSAVGHFPRLTSFAGIFVKKSHFLVTVIPRLTVLRKLVITAPHRSPQKVCESISSSLHLLSELRLHIPHLNQRCIERLCHTYLDDDSGLEPVPSFRTSIRYIALDIHGGPGYLTATHVRHLRELSNLRKLCVVDVQKPAMMPELRRAMPGVFIFCHVEHYLGYRDILAPFDDVVRTRQFRFPDEVDRERPPFFGDGIPFALWVRRQHRKGRTFPQSVLDKYLIR